MNIDEIWLEIQRKRYLRKFYYSRRKKYLKIKIEIPKDGIYSI
jgi:hypothetical protein